MTRKLLKTWKYKAGYHVRYYEFSDEAGLENGDTMMMRMAFTPRGFYLGDPKMARFLILKKGLDPLTIQPLGNDSNGNGGFGLTAQIGFHNAEQKWYGWSHRAIHGFGVGDVVKEGDVCAISGWTDEYLEEHPEDDLSLSVGFEAKDLDDVKKMAVAFAEGVG